MRDHLPIVISDIQGLYERDGVTDAIPDNALSIAKNIVYTDRGWSTRPGTSLLHTVGTVRRMVHYNRLNEVSRLLILDESGNLFDQTNLIVPILSIPEMVDFSAAQYFNRIYITPHNRETGIENEKVYVYDGTTCRPAGGAAPSGILTAVNSALSGKVEAGTHIFAIAYETDSGYVTKPGPAVYATVIADGEHKVELSGIPVGPAGTIARRILATRRISTYDGNQDGYVFYYVPTGRIANNTDTTATVDFYDVDLLSEADYLFDQLDEIPAGVGIGVYQESLVVWGEYDNPSVIRVSRQGDPEAFDGAEGYITIAPNEAGGIKNAAEFRDSLYITKGQRTYATSRDLTNPNSAIFWRVVNIDEGIGAECFGIATVLDTSGPNTDNLILAARSGVFLFNGIFLQPEFSWKVDKLWHEIDRSRFNEIQIFNDVVQGALYILLPSSEILVADYRNGLSYTGVRWSVWTFPWEITAITLDVDLNEDTKLLIAGNGNIWKLDAAAVNDDVEAIDTHVRYAHRTPVTDGGVCHFHAVRFRAVGSGELELKFYSEDLDTSVDLIPITLDASPGKQVSRLANFVNEKCALDVKLLNASEKVEVLDVKLFAGPLWMERPDGGA